MNLPDHKVLAKGSDGPFLCSMCEYFNGKDRCRQSYIVEHFGGKVGGDWCCDFFTKDPSLTSTAGLIKKSMKK